MKTKRRKKRKAKRRASPFTNLFAPGLKKMIFDHMAVKRTMKWTGHKTIHFGRYNPVKVRPLTEFRLGWLPPHLAKDF